MADVPFGKYSSTGQYAPDKPAWVPPAHAERVGAYGIYEEIYWTHVNSGYKIMNRGLDASDEPVYVPSSRIIIETVARYVGAKLTFQVEPTTGTPESRLTAQKAFQNLFARERFKSKYNANKRSGLIKGDWLWHITADLDKPEGSRISILTVQPEHYFPVFEDEIVENGDPDKLVAVHLVEPFQFGDEARIRVQTYAREDDTVLSGLSVWKAEDWYDDTKSPVEVVTPPTPLPAGITTIPVYFIPNGYEIGEWFGNSEMRGLVGLQAALNQTATDEDLSIALMGIGLYATESTARPTNHLGEQVDWFVSPGAVLQGAKGLRRVEGVTTLAPFTEHVNRLEGYMGDAVGATDAARGRIEVAEAESGVALELRLGPTLAHAAERDDLILDVHRQMFHDLVKMWLPLEGVNVTDVSVIPVLGDKLPINRKAEVSMVTELVMAKVISAASARTYLLSKGMAGLFDEVTEGDLILAETTALAAAESGGAGGLAEREDEELGAVTDA